jgi:four helix bundle protein
MGVRRFEDLVVWRLSRDLQDAVFAFTARPPACHDAKYCDQIRESSRSAPRNVAEGFGRYAPRDFARFLTIAVASLHETKNHLRDGHDRRYLQEEHYEQLFRLTLRAIKAGNRLLRYLRTARPPSPTTT